MGASQERLRFPENITIGDKYGPAMKITEQAEADAYFEACVEHTMRFGHSRERAEEIERANIGYYGGYYDAETMARTQRLFRCAHPLFGVIAADLITEIKKKEQLSCS